MRRQMGPDADSTVPAAPLRGVGVLVTRPAHQAESLCDQLVAAGATPVRFPVLEIQPTRDPSAASALLSRLDESDIVIFVSANAVRFALEYPGVGASLAAAGRVAAVGRRTADALRERGVQVDIVPAGRQDSEALLAHDGLQAVGGRRVVIVRGEGGREHLAETLHERGARVEYAELYRRVRPVVDTAALMTRWRGGDIDVAVVTSAEALANLYEMIAVEHRELLLRTPLVVMSERIAERGRELGFREVLVVPEASDAGLVSAIKHWRGAQGSGPQRGPDE